MFTEYLINKGWLLSLDEETNYFLQTKDFFASIFIWADATFTLDIYRNEIHETHSKTISIPIMDTHKDVLFKAYNLLINI